MSTWEDFGLLEGWEPEGRGGEEEEVLFLGMRWSFWSSSIADTLPKCSLERGGVGVAVNPKIMVATSP